MENKEKYYPIFRLDVCNQLLMMGHNIKRVRKNFTNDGNVVFMMDCNQDDVNSALERIQQIRKIERGL